MSTYLFKKASVVLAVTLGMAVLFSPSAGAATVAYYRFDNGTPGTTATGASTILDSTAAAGHNGTPAGMLAYSADVPLNTIPQTGATDLASLDFANFSSVTFGYSFPLNTLTSATLEFWLKSPGTTTLGHGEDFFWTRTDSTDSNRFNIGTGANALNFDYRSPSGVRHTLNTGVTLPITPNAWTFFAITKQANVWTFYENGSLMGSYTDAAPDLPTNTGWTFGGRNVESAEGLLDEVRISDVALLPSQFLNVPEPGTWALLVASGIMAGGAARRRRLRR